MNAAALARNLIALAAPLHDGTIGEEQRTAAWQACRVIRERGLEVVAAIQVAALAPSDGRAHVWTPPPVPVRIIASRFAGSCVMCGEQFAPGATVAWWRAHGSAHHACWKRWCR